MSNVENQAVDTAQIPGNACTEQVNAKYAKRCIASFLTLLVFGTCFGMFGTSFLALLIAAVVSIVFFIVIMQLPANSFINTTEPPKKPYSINISQDDQDSPMINPANPLYDSYWEAYKM